MSGALPWRFEGDDVLLSVRLTPRAAKESIGGVWRDSKGAAWLCASVRAVPEKGKANDALIALVSKLFLIPPSAISLDTGGVSRLKRLRIVGAGAQALLKLQSLTGEA